MVKKSEQNRTKNAKKELFIKSFLANGFNISKACEESKVGRTTYYDWMDNDKEFADAIEEAQEKLIDSVEDALYGKILDGDTTSIIFFLKTKAKKRGYVEKQEIDSNIDMNVHAKVIKLPSRKDG